MSADAVSGAIKIVAEGLEIVATTHEKKNTPEAIEAARRADEAKAFDAMAEAVAKGDLDTIRKNIAE